MKLQLKQSDLYRFGRLVSKLVKPNEVSPVVSVISCNNGIQLTTICREAALTLTIPLRETFNPFTLDWNMVKEISAKKNDIVEFDVIGNSVTVIRIVNGIPQQQRYDMPEQKMQLPPKPKNTTTHSVQLFDALADACRCTDSENAKYSLGAICFRGASSQILSTDGRQALLQDGFEFSWQKDVLCPTSKIFASKELREVGESVEVGYDANWIYFNIGNVNIWFKEIDGKYPQLDRIAADVGERTWLHIDPADAVFVASRIGNLPGGQFHEKPVYIDTLGAITIRAHDPVQKNCVALRLVHSRCEGKLATASVNRMFLKNALEIGIDRIGISPNEPKPLICYGENKTFVIMPLEGTEPEYDRQKLNVLETSRKMDVVPEKTRTTPLSVPMITTAAKTIKPVVETPLTGKPNLLADAENIRMALKTSLSNINSLITEIKKQRRHEHIMKTTIENFRKLQNI